MSLLVRDVVEGLAAAELFGSNIFMGKDVAEMEPTQEKRMLLLVQQACNELYRRFCVRQKSVWLTINPTQTDYLLTGQQPYLHQGFTRIDQETPLTYELDAAGLPIIPKRPIWDNDLKKVRGVYTIAAERIPLNTDGRRFSVYLPAYNQLALQGTMQYPQLHILYDCNAPKLAGMDDDTGLPETALTALRSYVARAYYMSVPDNEGMKRMQFYTQEYQSAMQELTTLEQFQTREIYFSREILKGKWNR